MGRRRAARSSWSWPRTSGGRLMSCMHSSGEREIEKKGRGSCGGSCARHTIHHNHTTLCVPLANIHTHTISPSHIHRVHTHTLSLCALPNPLPHSLPPSPTHTQHRPFHHRQSARECKEGFCPASDVGDVAFDAETFVLGPWCCGCDWDCVVCLSFSLCASVVVCVWVVVCWHPPTTPNSRPRRPTKRYTHVPDPPLDHTRLMTYTLPSPHTRLDS